MGAVKIEEIHVGRYYVITVAGTGRVVKVESIAGTADASPVYGRFVATGKACVRKPAAFLMQASEVQVAIDEEWKRINDAYRAG